jgi:hypothetical protein
MSGSEKGNRDPNPGNAIREKTEVDPTKTPPDPNEKIGKPNKEVPRIGDDPKERPIVKSKKKWRNPNSPNEKHGYPDAEKPNDGEHAIKRSDDKGNDNQNNNINE